MSDVAYREYAPRAALASFVHCIWTFEASADATPQPIAPDGRCELILTLGAPYVELGADTPQPPLLFAGQLTKPLTLVARGAVSVVGIRFHPHAARSFLGRAADGATDKRLDLVALHGEPARAMLDAAREAPAEARALAEDYIARRVEGAKLDESVRVAVEAMFAERELAPPLGLSERQWQRRFKAEVGVSPRMLQTILRFRRVFDAFERPGPPGWVEAALAAGYFDQPQMARDFRRFLGVSSRQWAAQHLGLSKALTTPVSETYKK